MMTMTMPTNDVGSYLYGTRSLCCGCADAAAAAAAVVADCLRLMLLLLRMQMYFVCVPREPLVTRGFFCRCVVFVAPISVHSLSFQHRHRHP
jgi:hypothetical protein